MHKNGRNGLMWTTLALCAFAVAGCQHNRDPWNGGVKPARLQTELNLGLHQHAQLHTRQLIGQSDR